MSKFVYLAPEKWSDGPIRLDAPKAHHLQRVLRLKHESQITLFDGKGRMAQSLLSFDKKDCTLQIVGRADNLPKPHLNITAIIALIKGERMDSVIEKCTELGVSKIHPVVTERTVVSLNKEKRAKRVDKYRQATIRASEQSENGYLPLVQEISLLAEALQQTPDCTKWVFCARKQQHAESKSNVVKSPEIKDVAFVVGPEGGLTDDEIDLAISHGFDPVHLGRNVLRADTAAIAAMSLISFASSVFQPS